MKIGPTLTNLILIFFLQFAISAVTGQQCKGDEDKPWSYKGDSNGPDDWSKTYSMCGGDAQSPIDIDTSSVESSDLAPLKMINYDTALKRAEVKNNGYFVVVTPQDSTSRYVEIDDKRYKLRQFNLHFSNVSEQGTEHSMDGKRYGMEMQFEHVSDDNKTAMVAVLFKAQSEENDALQEIVRVLPKVRYAGFTANTRDSIDLQQFFPGNIPAFYKYQGSMTSPPCSEGITWAVVKNVLNFGDRQLMRLTRLYTVPRDEAKPECTMTTNVRPVQDLNGRTVSESQSADS